MPSALAPSIGALAISLSVPFFDGLADFPELESRISQLAPQERGDAFEVFAEAYLATQKLLGAKEVWPADQVPIALLQACSLPVKDLGADGVYKTLGGQHNAYQSKFRTGRPSLTWQELSTFMGLTDQVGERVLFTNCDDLPAVMDARSGFFCIRGTDLERLTKEDLKAIADWLRGGVFTPKRKEPRPHQSEALEAILAGVEEHDRVTAVMACGTGKTLVSLWLAQRRNAKRILVLVPSLALIRQTLHQWLKETEWDQPRFIAVCSDPTVTTAVEDTLIVHQRDLDFPVTTAAGEVRDFLAVSGDSVQIVFSTYQSAHVVGEAAQGMNAFDLGIFDEAHKTAGREGANFGFALQDRNLPIAKRIFLTATPRHYDVRKKDKEGNEKLVYSMDEPKIYGPIVHTLSFAKAARQGIICNYKVIISVVTGEMVNADFLSRGEVIVEGDVVLARTVANQIAIQKACEAHELKKIFSFHRSVASARDFTGDEASSIKAHLPGYQAYHVNGEMRTSSRERLMHAFRDADRALMSNARCLTEGVDVPTVDVVAFLSPRKSKVDIVQAAGRAMRTAPGKETGYVLLPLFLEAQESETIEDALERTDFEEAWDVLQAMQEQDAVLAEIIREMREERGRQGGFDDSRLREMVEVLGPEVSLQVLRNAVSTALVDRLGVTWDERYGELKRYKEHQGDCNVPKDWNHNPQLGSWVGTQRALHAKGCLLPARKDRLDGLGFVWDPQDYAWEMMYAELRRYKDSRGHCDVSRAWGASPKLCSWVILQRWLNSTRRLSPERVTRLDDLGFISAPSDIAWKARFAELKSYKDVHDNCNVPRNWPENPQLGWWVGSQRAFHKKGKLPSERKRMLDDLGFVWVYRFAVTEQMLAELKRYRDEHHNCNVPKGWRKNPKLGNWVNTCRQRHKLGTLPVEQKTRLDKFGFDWDPYSAGWEASFIELERYRKRFGHCNVPRGWAENPRLAEWANLQRFQRRKRKLSAGRIARLEALGLVWNPRDAQWEAMFAELQRYKDECGNCNVPSDCKVKVNPQLGVWVRNLRARPGSVSPKRRARLDELGFQWGSPQAASLHML